MDQSQIIYEPPAPSYNAQVNASVTVFLALLGVTFIVTVLVIVLELLKEKRTKKQLEKSRLIASFFYGAAALYFLPVILAVGAFLYTAFHDTGMPIEFFGIVLIVLLPSIVGGITSFRYAQARRKGSPIKHKVIMGTILLITPFLTYYFITFFFGLFGLSQPYHSGLPNLQ